jgi:hypothetical protein
MFRPLQQSERSGNVNVWISSKIASGTNNFIVKNPERKSAFCEEVLLLNVSFSTICRNRYAFILICYRIEFQMFYICATQQICKCVYIVVFWDTTPCRLVGLYQNFQGKYCLQILVPTWRTTRCHNPEYYNMNHQSYEDLRSHTPVTKFLSALAEEMSLIARQGNLILNCIIYSSVCIATGCDLDGRGFNPGRGKFFLYSTASRSALGSTRPSIQ